jgi:ribosomal protein L14
VGLPFDYGVGVDIRFQRDAIVVIVAKELPDSEMVRQMVARGVRSMGA